MSASRRQLLAALALAAALTSAPCASQAQEQSQVSTGLLQEIMVTATRREESVQDIPIAVTAFSEAQLETLNVTETLDLVKLVPNLIGHNNTGLGTANTYSLRALNNTESIATFDPPVGSYVDDVFIARQNANNFALFDVDRIEVLRGPQGTLFGRNTTGGAINVILKKPAAEFGGFVEAGFGQFSAISVRASVDMPISERVLTKLSAFQVRDDGFVSNPTTGEDDLNSADNFGVRGALRFLASDAVTWDLAVDHLRSDEMNLMNFSLDGPQLAADAFQARRNVFGQATLVPPNPSIGLVAPLTVATTNCFRPTQGPITRSRFACTGLRQDASGLVGIVVGNKQNFPLGNEVRSTSVVSNLQWDAPLGTLNFITGYRRMEQDFSLDFFNNPASFGGFVIANEGVHKQFSQEIKLNGSIGENIQHTTGIYYFKEDNNSDFGDVFNVGIPFVLEDRILDNTAKAIAVYSQWDFTFADAWTLTLGGRYTKEDKDIDFTSNINPRIATPLASRVNSASIAAAGVPLSQEESQFNPRIALQYTFNDDVNVFLSATEGFKSGGWNARGTAANEILPFLPETARNYELGLKSSWLDGKVRFNVTAFKMDVEDFQLPSAFIRANGSIAFITRNFADLKNDGVEIEFVWQPVSDVNLFAYIGQQSAEYDNIGASILTQQAACRAAIAAFNSGMAAALPNPNCSAGIVTPVGDIAPPVRAPDTVTLGASWRIHLGDQMTLTPAVDAQRLGEHSVGTNGAPISLQESYTVWNASLRLAGKDKPWSITADCKNCGNETYIVSTLSELPYTSDPRTWGVTFKYRFGER